MEKKNENKREAVLVESNRRVDERFFDNEVKMVENNKGTSLFGKLKKFKYLKIENL